MKEDLICGVAILLYLVLLYLLTTIFIKTGEIVGITLALQFGNALPKNITGCKNITVVDCAARRAYPRAVA